MGVVDDRGKVVVDELPYFLDRNRSGIAVAYS